MRILPIVLGLSSVLLGACAADVAPPADGDSMSVESPLEATGKVEFYMVATGQKTGVIKGESKAKSHPNEIAAFRFTSGSTTPTDPTSGLPTGKLQLAPVTITKAFDKSDPLFLQVQSTNENLTSVVFTFVKVAPDGTTSDWQKVTLANARVVDLQRATMELDDAAKTSMLADTITFEYQKLTLQDLAGNVVATVDRSSPAN